MIKILTIIIYLFLLNNLWAKPKNSKFEKSNLNIVNYNFQNIQNYLEILKSKIEQNKSFEKKYWKLLLHYNPHKKKYISEADGLNFFFSWDGKKNAKAEMLATLQAFSEDPNDYEENRHPQCRFPARYKWLKDELKIDNKIIKEVPCSNLNFWLKNLEYSNISIVFASHFLDAPASTFGHTFLKLKSSIYKETDLLGNSINFAALAQNVGIIEYFIKGISGGFPGLFGVYPYHVKVKEYNNVEKRDLWEYNLNLTKNEIYKMLLHVWELNETYFDYFFFKENCSYHILSLIEIARPSVSLRTNFSTFTIPAETIKIIYKEGMVENYYYRPSTSTVMKQRLSSLDKDDIKYFNQLYEIKDPQKVLKNPKFLNKELEKQINIIDTAIYGIRETLEDEKSENKKIIEKVFYEELLLERSKLPSPKNEFKVIEIEKSPHLSHSIFSLKTLIGTSNVGKFISIGVRPPIHELLNIDHGYPLDSSVLFCNLDLRFYENQKWPYLYDLTFLRLLNLSPYESYNKSLSYDVYVKIGSEFLKKDENGALFFDKEKELKFANTFETGGAGGVSAIITEKNRFLYSVLVGGVYRYAPGRAFNRHTIAPLLSNRFLIGSGFFRAEFLVDYFYYSLLFKVQSELNTSLRLRFLIKPQIETYVEYGIIKNYNQLALSFVWHL